MRSWPESRAPAIPSKAASPAFGRRAVGRPPRGRAVMRRLYCRQHSSQPGRPLRRFGQLPRGIGQLGRSVPVVRRFLGDLQQCCSHTAATASARALTAATATPGVSSPATPQFTAPRQQVHQHTDPPAGGDGADPGRGLGDDHRPRHGECAVQSASAIPDLPVFDLGSHIERPSPPRRTRPPATKARSTRSMAGTTGRARR